MDVFLEGLIYMRESTGTRLRVRQAVIGGEFHPGQPRYSEETLAAIREARDIMSGKVIPRRYKSLKDLLDDIDSEDETNF